MAGMAGTLHQQSLRYEYDSTCYLTCLHLVRVCSCVTNILNGYMLQCIEYFRKIDTKFNDLRYKYDLQTMQQWHNANGCKKVRLKLREKVTSVPRNEGGSCY